MDDRKPARTNSLPVTGHITPATHLNRPLRFSIWLACLTVLLIATVLRVGSNGQSIYVAGNESLVIPETCLFVRWLNVRCVGCGLTRGVIRTMQGDPRNGWQFHPAAPAFAGFVAFHFVFQGYWLLRNRNPPATVRHVEVFSAAGLLAWIAFSRTAVSWLSN